MWMSRHQIDEYPIFAKYVQESMPTCKGVYKIVHGLMKYGGLSKSQAETALDWGSEPKVVVIDMWDEEAWESTGNGRFDPKEPHRIYIAKHRVDQFETPGAGGTDLNAAGAPVYIVGATLLHELCHWGLHKVGKREHGEAGKRFGKAV